MTEKPMARTRPRLLPMTSMCFGSSIIGLLCVAVGILLHHRFIFLFVGVVFGGTSIIIATLPLRILLDKVPTADPALIPRKEHLVVKVFTALTFIFGSAGLILSALFSGGDLLILCVLFSCGVGVLIVLLSSRQKKGTLAPKQELHVSEQETTVRRNTFRLSITCFCLGFTSFACVMASIIIAQAELVEGGSLLGFFACLFALRAVGGLVYRLLGSGVPGVVVISKKRFLAAALLTSLGAIFGIAAIVTNFLIP